MISLTLGTILSGVSHMVDRAPSTMHACLLLSWILSFIYIKLAYSQRVRQELLIYIQLPYTNAAVVGNLVIFYFKIFCKVSYRDERNLLEVSHILDRHRTFFLLQQLEYIGKAVVMVKKRRIVQV